MSNNIIKDRFEKLKTTVLGVKTADIDSTLDSASKSILSYKSQSGRNGYVDLVKSLISKTGNFKFDASQSSVLGGANISPAMMGQGGRLHRYKTYETIVDYVNYCYRALSVLTENIISPDDITKVSLEIKPDSFLEDEVDTESKQNIISEIIKEIELEDNLELIVRSTLLYGDLFAEIADAKTALTSKSLLAEQFRFGEDSERFTVTENKESAEFIIDYSSFTEAKDDSRKRKDQEDVIKNIHIIYHHPKYVVKLQSDIFPVCFGYLVFPKTAINPHLSMQDNMINSICQTLLKNLADKIPQMKGFTNDKDLKEIIAAMVSETSQGKAVNIRYIPPSKMQHFKRPTQKYQPYGESIFDSTQYSAKVLIALETALAIQRLSRSTEKRQIGVEIGLPRDARNAIEAMKEAFRKRKISLDSFGTIDTIPCLDLNTKINLTNNKSIPLKDLIYHFDKGSQFEVFSYDHKTGQVRPDKVVSAKITGRNVEVIKVILDNDKEVICTPDHLWMLRDGTYIQAKDLKPNDSLMPLYKRYTKYSNNKGIKYQEIYHPGTNNYEGNWELTHKSFANYLNLYEGKNVCHHINKNPIDNSTWNLQGCTYKEHSLIHSNDMDNGFNGKSIGNKIENSFECVICGKRYNKSYWSSSSVCSDKCLSLYKKEYSINSWKKRKHAPEYKILKINCFFCSDEFTIRESLYNRYMYKNRIISCNKCKDKQEFANRVISRNGTQCDIVYNICENCEKIFITSFKNSKQYCSMKCANTQLSIRRWNNKTVKEKCKCDNCGKELFIVKPSTPFISCDLLDCRRLIKKLNWVYTNNNSKLFSDIYFDNCCICNKLTSFNENKTGFIYSTCGSKSCSSSAMHQQEYNKISIGRNHKVKQIIKLYERIDVGDIQTENFHNFAIEDSVFIHNSMITTFEDVYIPMKDGKKFVELDTFTAGNVDTRSKVDELKLLRDQTVASLGVPASFLNLEESLSNKAALSEESILFARTIVGHQKYLTNDINGLLKKILEIVNPEEALTLFDNVIIAFAPPKSLQYEREARYMTELANLIETLERIGIPKEYSKKRYLTSIDWEEVDKYKIDEDLDKALNIKDKEYGEGSGSGMGGMGGIGGVY